MKWLKYLSKQKNSSQIQPQNWSQFVDLLGKSNIISIALYPSVRTVSMDNTMVNYTQEIVLTADTLTGQFMYRRPYRSGHQQITAYAEPDRLRALLYQLEDQLEMVAHNLAEAFPLVIIVVHSPRVFNRN